MTTNPPSGPQKRRPLPVVSDVVRELATLSRAEQPDLFKAARQVCAEELSRVKQGLEPASLEAVVQKAVRLLDPATLLPVAPPRPAASVKSLLDEDPFLETTGAIDLKQIWAKKPSSPLEDVSASASPFELEAEPSPFVEAPAPAAGPDVFVLDEVEEAPAAGMSAASSGAGAIRPDGPEVGAFDAGAIRPDGPEVGAFGAGAIGPGGPEVGAFGAGAFRPDGPEVGAAGLSQVEAGPGEETLRRLSQEAAGVDIRSIVAARAEASEIPEAGEDTGSHVDQVAPAELEEPSDLPPPSLEMPFPLSAFPEPGLPAEAPASTRAEEARREPVAFATPSLELPVPDLPLMELPLPELPPLPAFPVEMPLQPGAMAMAAGRAEETEDEVIEAGESAPGAEALDVEPPRPRLPREAEEREEPEELEEPQAPEPETFVPYRDFGGESPVERAPEPELVHEPELPPSAYELPPVTAAPMPTAERFTLEEEPRPRSRPDVPAPSFGAPERATPSGRRSRAPVLIVVAVLAVAAAAFLYWRSRGTTTPPVPEGTPATASPSTSTEAPTVSTPPVGEAPVAPIESVATTATAVPASAPTPKPVPPTPVPERPRPTPTAVRAPVVPPEPQPVATKPPAGPAGPPGPAAAAGQKRAGTIVTPEWADREPIYVIHFTSYQEKAKAEKDVERLARKLGLTARAVSLDLGEKGTWYRVVLGEFATAEEALQKRAELEAQSTPEMGLVYRLVGKK